MSLDLNKVAAQIEGMAQSLKSEQQDRESRLGNALDTLRLKSADVASLRKKIENSKTTWLVAGLTNELSGRYKPVPCHPDFAVLAADGSHIDVDRHTSARCCLINIGSVVLRYGNKPDAMLRSEPMLYASEQDLTIVDPLGSGSQPIERDLLGIKRAVAECQALVELCEELPADMPALALLDGTLILWGLGGQAYPDYVRKELLENGFLQALDKLREIGRNKKLALASYISFPRSTDVVNALRVALCPYDPPDCDRNCPRSVPDSQRACEAVAGVQDSALFSRILEHGERSATFISRSSVVQKHYGENEVRFFYLKTDEEIARVEFPRWAEERGLVDMLQTLVLDQCRRGQGYPVALSEAHEQAVVTGADREQFQYLVELALSEKHLPTATSAKSRSKRTKWI
ncbi:MAG: DNA double-strand break repair nuclease NurA [Chloroflexi bacterium]|nr:DNA double-strand break repair nuclease NurA [Chloroflexota bacterium]